MAALTEGRDTPRREGDLFSLPVYQATKIFQGGIVMLNATGYAVPGAVAASQICAGRAEETVDNSAGGDGDLNVKVRSGVFKFGNAGDITIAHVGSTGYIVDDQTVSSDDDTSARSEAGTIVSVDSDGVWVRMGL